MHQIYLLSTSVPTLPPFVIFLYVIYYRYTSRRSSASSFSYTSLSLLIPFHHRLLLYLTYRYHYSDSIFLLVKWRYNLTERKGSFEISKYLYCLLRWSIYIYIYIHIYVVSLLSNCAFFVIVMLFVRFNLYVDVDFDVERLLLLLLLPLPPLFLPSRIASFTWPIKSHSFWLIYSLLYQR